MKRRFLLLQGVNSPFFARLSDRLNAQGHRTFRVNFCAGDALVWGVRPAWHYRGALSELPGYLEDKFQQHRFTDLILFGDQRPVHKPAVAIARQRGARVLVFEEGYVRPNWVTLDRGGANAHSSLPRDPAWYRRVSGRLARCGTVHGVGTRLSQRATYDMAYHLANALNPLCFPAYRTHRPHNALVEYAGWAKRYAGMARRSRRDANLIKQLLISSPRYFLLPLQLNSDAQIRDHSPYGGMKEVLAQVLRSFSVRAPAGTRLLVKNHPLDTGLVPYERLIGQMARELDIVGRVHFIETGDLPVLLDHALGLVTVNSTTGMSALMHRCPTLALGQAIFDLPGLTHQGGLDEFWRQPSPPDAELFAAFRNTVIHTTQVNGGLYDRAGIELTLRNADRLLQMRSPIDELPV